MVRLTTSQIGITWVFKMFDLVVNIMPNIITWRTDNKMGRTGNRVGRTDNRVGRTDIKVDRT